ncbi:MAG: hypothetical protein ACI3XY_00270 [Butyricicoccaceae bacterium]
MKKSMLVSPTLINDLYKWIINGNEDIHFSCTRLRSADPEKASNSPIEFGMKLLRANIVYRLPFCGKKRISVPGTVRLSECFRRRRVHEFITAALKCECVYVDAMDSILELPMDTVQFYRAVGQRLQLKEFAQLRAKYDRIDRPLQVIYEKISAELGETVDFEVETGMLEELLDVNSYLARAVEILHCGDMPIHIVAETSLSAQTCAGLLRHKGIPFHTVHTTGDLGCSKARILRKIVSGRNAAALSSDFKHFLKPSLYCGCEPYFYISDAFIAQRIKTPLPKGRFADVYLHVISRGLLTGQHTEQPEYEAAYLYLAPVVYAAAYRLAGEKNQIQTRLDEGDFLPRLMQDEFDVTCTFGEGADELCDYFAAALDRYREVYGVLINEGGLPSVEPIIQDAIRDYCCCFHRLSRHAGVLEQELEQCGALLLDTAQAQVIRLFSQGGTV